MQPLTALTDRLDRWRRRVLRHRRLLAALATATAGYLLVQAATAPPPPTVAVWTAARDLASGTVLAPGDLRPAPFTPQSVPEHRVGDPGQVLGRTLAAPLSKGMAVTTDAVVGDGWLARRPGLVAVPVRVTDAAVAGLLRVGDRVRLLASDPARPGPATDLVPEAVVLAIPAEHVSNEGFAGTALPGRLVLFGVPRRLSATAAGATSMVVTVTWDG